MLGVVCLDDIINQIIQIDSVAYDNMKKNQQFLLNKKQEYENIITNYRNEKIAIAKFNAEQINKSIDESLIRQEEAEKEKIKKISLELEEKYSAVEEELLQKIFNRLFISEG